ncbi:MAG: hypothetical protein Q8900_06500 [Bacillota bacterium]|nr:hypothetical protein [Bacillota bacterium]
MEMNNKVKIKISESAYIKLLEILDGNQDYSHVKFSHFSGCGKCSKIEVSLDNNSTNDFIEDKIDNLPVLYNKNLHDSIKEIILIYKNSNFMIKAINNENIKKTSCGGSCSLCSNCNKCSKSLV